MELINTFLNQYFYFSLTHPILPLYAITGHLTHFDVSSTFIEPNF